jgi:uncharacterized protein with PQ loop repeat
VKSINKISIALCGGLMLGISVPVIAASAGKGAFVLFGIFMLLVSIALLYAGQKPATTPKIILLSLHAFIAFVTLFLTLNHESHTFLIVWSCTVFVLAVFSLRAISKEKQI